MTKIDITVETSTTEKSPWVDGRLATIKLGPVKVFSELVYDTNPDGERTEEQAVLNVLRIFGERLQQLVKESLT